MTVTAADSVRLCITAQQELFGAGRLELADELVTPDFRDHGGEVGPAVGAADDARGPEAVRKTVRWLRGAFPDLRYEIHDAFGDDHRVAVRVTARGTHRGVFLGKPPTGRSFAAQQIHLFRVDGDRIAEHWACRDDVTVMVQLGLDRPAG